MPPKHIQARGTVHYQHQHPLDNQKSASTINAYININMTKSQNDKKKGEKRRKKERKKSTNTVNAYINTNAQSKKTSTIKAFIKTTIKKAQAL